MSKLVTGRSNSSPVWDYFTCVKDSNLSICEILKSEVKCRVRVKEKILLTENEKLCQKLALEAQAILTIPVSRAPIKRVFHKLAIALMEGEII